MNIAQLDKRSWQEDGQEIRRGGTAVILNANAKRVTSRVRRFVEQAAAGEADVFFTEDLDQAGFVTRRVADRGYDLVITGGGDGTVTHTIDQIIQAIHARGEDTYPRFAVLRLGTGNAVADFLSARDYQQDLTELDRARVRQVDLVQLDGQQYSTFGGFGWDAHILNNYEQLKEAASRFAPTRLLFKSVLGYLVAGLGKSMPEFIMHRPRWQVRVVNTGGMALRLDGRGQVVERFAPGATVFEGSTRMACFGTTPYFGFKFRIMPFADRTDGMMHLRLLDMPPLVAVRKLRRAWRGELVDHRVTDLVLSGCTLEFDRPAPFQIAGDAAGLRDRIDLSVNPRPLECLDFQA